MNIDTAYRLSQLRRERGYSQETLANQLGVSRQAVSKWERAESSPDTDNLIALADLYGMTLDELLKGPQAQADEASLAGADGAERAGLAAGGDGHREESASAGGADVPRDAGAAAPQEAEVRASLVAEVRAPRVAETGGSQASEVPGPQGSETDGSAGTDGVSGEPEPGRGVSDADGAAASQESAAQDEATRPGGQSGDYVHIGRDGLHVLSKDGSQVHIGRGGIHVYDPEDDDSVDVSRDGIVVNGVRYDSWRDVPKFVGIGGSGGKGHGKGSAARNFPWALVVLAAYVLVGVFAGEWARGLVMLFLIPLYYALVDAITASSPYGRRGGVEAFFVLLMLATFFALGAFWGLWHPGWIALLAIPVVLGIWEAISPRRRLAREPRARDDDER